eukprot:TRINITY_DN44374_c0_g1_i1.p1 TRINITY_DN44374_c0_g1~~TRINITY_DN44374_c0_g1_i1.p1  ORF type:complete len:347 (+),score=95.87 TRINITY_DN44374_c0_g1_i1:39-1043(+)
MAMLNILIAALMMLFTGSCGSMEACSEQEVEVSEDALALEMRQELLQQSFRHVKAGQEVDLGSDIHAEKAELNGELEEQDLALRLEKQQKSLSKLYEEVERSKEALHQLEERRQQGKLNQVQPSDGPVDCGKYPMFCSPKVNCSQSPLTAAERKSYETRLATADGKANQRSWCLAYPMYATSVQKCIVEGDARGYAKEMFESQKKLKLVEADAIYCFVAGHCNNTEVTDKTTMEQAEAVCDKLYGHERWTHIGWNDFMGVLARALELGTTHKVPKEWNVTGWPSLVKLAHHEAEISAMTACAMGNFQCDVAYCKANYCENPSFRQKFGNLSWVY